MRDGFGSQLIVPPLGQVRQGFQLVALKDFVFFQEGPGLRKWQWTDEGMKVINVTNILGDGTFDPTNTSRYIALDEFQEKYRHFAVEPNDVVVASSGNTYGKVSRVSTRHLPMMMNTSVIRLRPLEGADLDANFLFGFIRSPFFRQQVEQFVIGSAQPNFGPTHVALMKLILPPLPTQQRIAAILSAYDDLIENNTRRIAVLEEMARRLYEEWFVHFRFPGHEEAQFDGELPKGWQRVDLGALVDDRRDAVQPNSVDPSTPYVGLEHIPRRSITLREWSEASIVQSTKLIFREDDILFGKIRPYFHKVVLAPLGGVTSSDTIVLRAYSRDHLALAALCASSDAFVDHATQTSNGTKMPRADWKVLKSYPVALPDETLLARFNSFVLPLFATLKALNRKNANLRAQRDMLLPKLISGEIDVSGVEAVLEAAE